MTIKTTQPEHLPPRIIVGKMRRDGKFPTTYIYPGAPNMFGGRDHPSTFNKLHTAEQILEHDLDHYQLTDNSLGTFATARKRIRGTEG